MALKNGRTSVAVETILVGSVHPTGSGTQFWGTSAPDGWVLASGRTIGSGASGATERANNDTFALFELLWNSYSNTILAIQDSAGSASTRGASASADFAANKRLPLIDLRGRTPVGKDNMGGSAASRITSAGSGVDGLTLGAGGGAQTHTLTQAQLAAHLHTATAANDTHSHNIDAGSGNATATRFGELATTNANVLANASGYIISDTHTHTLTVANMTGGGGAHNNTQPSIICNYILKL
jgi:microcystin-dependent protein